MENNYRSSKGNHFNKGRWNDKPDSKWKRSQEYALEIAPLLHMSDKTVTTSAIKKSVESVKLLAEDIKKVKTHQVRNIYKLVQSAKEIKDLNLIRPRLAYIGARQNEKAGIKLVEVIDELIVKTSDESKLETLTNFKYIMESIVAFHKFFAKD